MSSPWLEAMMSKTSWLNFAGKSEVVSCSPSTFRCPGSFSLCVLVWIYVVALLLLLELENHRIKIKNLTIHIRFQSELQNQQQCQMSKNAQHTKWWFSSCVRPAQCMILTTFILTKLCSGVFFLFFKATLIWGFIFANGFFWMGFTQNNPQKYTFE